MVNNSDVIITPTKCPHCSTPHAQLNRVFSDPYMARGPKTLNEPRKWSVFRCSACAGLISARGSQNDTADNFTFEKFFPEDKSVPPNLPNTATVYLQQALDTAGADAKGMLAASAVEAMLKDKGFDKGTLAKSIEAAVTDHTLTKEMGDWAHQVRIISNDPRHADKDRPHLTDAEGLEAIEFAETLGRFLFSLPAVVARRMLEIEERKKAEQEEN